MILMQGKLTADSLHLAFIIINYVSQRSGLVAKRRLLAGEVLATME